MYTNENKENFIGRVQRVLFLAIDRIRSAPGILLTETDMQCHIYKLLTEEFPLIEETRTAGISANYVHTELKFYDENGELGGIRPDIVLVKPSKLAARPDGNFGVFVDSKNYGFTGKVILLELKYVRDSDLKTNVKDEILFDIGKARRLNQRYQSEDEFLLFSVVFCRKVSCVESVRVLFANQPNNFIGFCEGVDPN